MSQVNGPPVVTLIANFEQHLAYYEANPPFARAAQLASHLRTIGLRRELRTPADSLESDQFLDILAETLKAWGVGSHDAALLEPSAFRQEVRRHLNEIRCP